MPWYIDTTLVPTEHEHLLEEIIDGATTPADAEDIAILHLLAEPESVITFDVSHDSQFYAINVMGGIPNAFKVRDTDNWIDVFVPGKLFKRFVEESKLSLITTRFRE